MASPSVFISYSHKDEDWKDRLVTHLGVLENEGILDLWDDRRIEAGDDWKPKIEKAINNASIAILMVSANFLTSKFILGEEVPKLLERRTKEGVRVIPLIVKPCAWTQVKWLSPIQARPKDGRPLSSGNENQIDSDLAALANEIAAIVRRVETSDVSKPPEVRKTSLTILNKFSVHLDSCINELIIQNKNIKITGLGLGFLKKIKEAPPFLGLNYEQNEPAIYPNVERQLTEFFLALEFIEDNKKYIRGGIPYTVRPEQKTWESIARDQYGDEKFAAKIKAANPGATRLSTGQEIHLPYIHTNDTLRVSSEYIKTKYSIVQSDWIRPSIESLIDDYFLTEDEVLPLLFAIYEAAQRTLKEESYSPKS